MCSLIVFMTAAHAACVRVIIPKITMIFGNTSFNTNRPDLIDFFPLVLKEKPRVESNSTISQVLSYSFPVLLICSSISLFLLLRISAPLYFR